jgi:hypothetical protein
LAIRRRVERIHSDPLTYLGWEGGDFWVEGHQKDKLDQLDMSKGYKRERWIEFVVLRESTSN